MFHGWAVIGHVIENPPGYDLSVSRLMARYRAAWVVQMISCQRRVLDGMIIGILRQGTTFLAPTAMTGAVGLTSLVLPRCELASQSRTILLRSGDTQT